MNVYTLLLTTWFACAGGNPLSETGGSSSGDSQGTTSETDTGLPCPPADTAGDGTIAPECCTTRATLQIRGGESQPKDLEEGGGLPLSYSPQYGWGLQIFPQVCQTRDIVTLQVILQDMETGSTLQDETLTTALYPIEDGSCCGETWVRYESLDVRQIPGHEDRNLAETLCERTVSLTLIASDWDGRAATETLGLQITADEEALGHPCGSE